MRKVSGATALVFLQVCLHSLSPAQAETTSYQNNAQFGMSLPQASLPSGQDEIRTSDGTSCRSAVGGDGTYFDAGVVGTPGGDTVQAQTAAYGRIVVPFGMKSARLDCSKLYNLEIERLKMELQLARMGLPGQATGSLSKPASGDSWADEGWGTAKAPGKAAQGKGKDMTSASTAKAVTPAAKPAASALPQPTDDELQDQPVAVKAPAKPVVDDGWGDPPADSLSTSSTGNAPRRLKATIVTSQAKIASPAKKKSGSLLGFLKGKANPAANVHPLY